MSFWHFITNLGDSAVMLPCAVIIGLWLALACSYRLALRWAVCFALAGIMVAGSKLAFSGWGVGIRSLDFTGFSGHSMLGSAVLPVLTWLLLQPIGRIVRAAPILGAACAILVAWSRVHLGYHSVSEAVTGTAIGLTAAFSFLHGAPKTVPRIQVHRYALVFSLLAPIAVMHGTHAPTHKMIQQLGAYVAGNAAPFTRQDLHKQNDHPVAVHPDDDHEA